MDYPIEPYRMQKDLYYRYYNCVQDIGHVKCTKYDTYEEIEKQKKLYISKYDKTENINAVFPTYELNSVCFQIYNWVPLWADNIILKYNLHNLLCIHVKK